MLSGSGNDVGDIVIEKSQVYKNKGSDHPSSLSAEACHMAL